MGQKQGPRLAYLWRGIGLQLKIRRSGEAGRLVGQEMSDTQQVLDSTTSIQSIELCGEGGRPTGGATRSRMRRGSRHACPGLEAEGRNSPAV
jgi:hypothetical protein